MNSSQQAQKGFKTFILTLSVSLIIFSVIYYVINSSEFSPSPTNTAMRIEDEVLGVSAKEDPVEANNTVFGLLAEQEVEVPTKTVLAGADTMETTESTSPVPETGTFGVTVGLVSSLTIFVVGLFVIYKDPRKAALLGFERDVTKNL